MYDSGSPLPSHVPSPHLPPLLPVGPYVPTSDYLPYFESDYQGWFNSTKAYVTYDPPRWLDDLKPLLVPAAVIGGCVGGWRGATKRAGRFTAENAHRKPKGVKGWFYYKRVSNRKRYL